MKDYSARKEQDIILNYIQQNNINSGTLLDIGAYDGETYSNTRAIMLEYPKWKGVFIEPSSFSFQKLFKIYQNEPSRAELINLLIVHEDQLTENIITEFYDTPTHGAGSSRELIMVNRFINKKDEFGNSIDPRKVLVGKIGLLSIFEHFTNTNFEFMNIDIEGGSAKLVLQDWFNPLNYGCKLICIEHDNMMTELNSKLTKLGYKLIGYTGENLIFGL